MIYVGYALAALAYLLVGIVVARIYYIHFKEDWKPRSSFDGDLTYFLLFMIAIAYPIIISAQLVIYVLVMVIGWMIDIAIKLIPERNDD